MELNSSIIVNDKLIINYGYNEIAKQHLLITCNSKDFTNKLADLGNFMDCDCNCNSDNYIDANNKLIDYIKRNSSTAHIEYISNNVTFKKVINDNIITTLYNECYDGGMTLKQITSEVKAWLRYDNIIVSMEYAEFRKLVFKVMKHMLKIGTIAQCGRRYKINALL